MNVTVTLTYEWVWLNCYDNALNINPNHCYKRILAVNNSTLQSSNSWNCKKILYFNKTIWYNE